MTNYYNDYPEDPWSRFDPEVAEALREVFQREIVERIAPLAQESEDRAFAQEEAKMRAVYGDKFYAANRQAILNFALENSVTDLDLAVRAWRGSEGLPNDARPDTGNPDEAQASEKRKARLAELKYSDDHGANAERDELKQQEREYQDRAVERMFSAADAGEHRKEQLRDINQEHNIRNTQRTERAERGYIDSQPARRETREEMDQRTIELFAAADDQ